MAKCKECNAEKKCLYKGICPSCQGTCRKCGASEVKKHGTCANCEEDRRKRRARIKLLVEVFKRHLAINAPIDFNYLYGRYLGKLTWENLICLSELCLKENLPCDKIFLLTPNDWTI